MRNELLSETIVCFLAWELGAHKTLEKSEKKLDENGGQTQVNIEVTFFFFTVVIAQVITVTLMVIWLETQSVRVKKNSCNYQKNISSSL